MRVDGKRKQRMVVLTNDGTENGIGKPVALAVDPSHGKLYWLDEGGPGVPAKIGVADMDGQNPGIVVQGNMTSPEFLTLDPDTEMIYFSSSHEPKVDFNKRRMKVESGSENIRMNARCLQSASH